VKLKRQLTGFYNDSNVGLIKQLTPNQSPVYFNFLVIETLLANFRDEKEM